MKRLLAALLLVASPALAQSNGWREIQNGWGEIQTPPGYGTIPAPTGCTSGLVPYFNASLQLVCSPTVYAPTTDTTTAGTVVARNLTATALATPGAITVTPVLTQVGTINVVAGASLADGDYFTVEYEAGLTIPIEFDATPGNGTTGGRIPFVFAPGDSAGTIRDGLITLLGAAAPTKVTAAIGGAAAITVTRIPAGQAGVSITENVANAGFAVTGFVNPTAATTYGYKAVSYLADGTSTAASTEVTTAAGHATLSASNYNTVVFAPSPGSTSTRLYRTTGGAAPPKLLYTGTATSFVDSGQAGTAETPSTVNTTGTLTGRGVFATGTTVTPGTGTATARVGGALHVSTTAQATTGTSEEVLATYTMPANTLARDGQAVRITAWFTHAANTNGTTSRIRFGGIGGTVVATLYTAISADVMRLQATVVRTGAATQTSVATNFANSGGQSVTVTSPTQTLSNAVDVVVSATTSVAAGDVTVLGMIVEALN